jgi:hypothetical protein
MLSRVLASLTLACSLQAPLLAQGVPRLPFGVGEKFTYALRVSRVGTIGHGEMWIEGPVVVKGISTWVLRFDTKAGFAMVRGKDFTTSWYDPARGASVKFDKREREPLSNHDEVIEMDASTRKWAEVGGSGSTGESLTDAPLDELSFMYFIRTLSLADDSLHTFQRHFDAARNPTTIRVLGHETLDTKAGTFPTIIVEMKVRDPRHYRGEGTIRINLSDDAHRMPVRIQSEMPVFGTAVLTLESFVLAPETMAARAGNPDNFVKSNPLEVRLNPD